jgi:CHAT domain-containing protein/Tfp pilus assembly protein PilF
MLARTSGTYQILPLLMLLAQAAPGASSPGDTPRVDFQQTPAPLVTTPPATPRPDALVPGQPVTRELANGQKHTYAIELTAGQFVNVEFEGRGVNAALRIYDSAGERINMYEVAPSMTGQQTIELVAGATGSYRLDVTGKPTQATAPGYTLQLTIPRPATEQETALFQARRMYLEANALTAAGKQDEALALTQQSLVLREKYTGTENVAVANSFYQLGVIFHAKGDFPRSVAHFLRALAIKEKLNGPDSSSVSPLVNNLGAIYNEMGDYDKAEQFMQRAVSIQEKQHILNDPTLAITLHNLGNLQDAKGDYNSAEQTYQRALTIKEQAYGAEQPDTAETMAALANISQEKGDYERALSLNERALSIYEKTVGEDDIRTAETLLNFADVYSLTGETARAASLDERALKIFEKILETDHPHIALALNNLGESMRALRDFPRAEKLLLRALEIREKKLGAAHPDVGMTLENLGHLYRDQGDYNKAENFYRRALKVKEKALGTEHPSLVSTLTEMSLLYAAKGDFTEAVAFQTRAVAVGERNADLNLLGGSERQKLAYLELLSDQLNEAITLNVKLAPGQIAARDLAATIVLQRKGRVQDALADSLSSLRRRLDPKDVELLDEFNRTTSQLSHLVLGDQQSSTDDYPKRVSALRERRERLEADISRRSAEFRARAQAVTLEAVRATIPENATLLEFIAYKPLSPKAATREGRYGETRYAIYVIRKRGDVKWQDLGAAREVDGAIDAWRQALRDPNRRDVRQLARVVDEKVMQPVRALLAGDAAQLLVSPDGELNLMPFAALVDERGRYLVERYSFTYLTSGRDLLHMGVTRQSKSKPVIIANPSFGESLAAGQLANSTAIAGTGAQRRSVTAARNLSDVYFAPLGGTTQEARGIQKLFTDASLLAGDGATESALKGVVAPRILHIATHGFFLQDVGTLGDTANTLMAATRKGRGAASAQIENPLLRSGLALAGANSRNGGGGSSGDDGILTALEASGLNLWGTKLVVLSACDTGLGEVRNGEGVYGLRRAFVLAGTESVVMSLWPVSDYSTRRLMTDYYKNLKQGLGRGASLRQVQLDMLKRDENLHPFYWANFIQSGEWANLTGQR